VNALSVSQRVDIDLEGVKLADTAKLVSISAKTQRETNSIDDTERIVPVESTLKGVNSKFHHTLPAYSIQVVQFDMQ
jgi:alpha-N-arabinofuranosidase